LIPKNKEYQKEQARNSQEAKTNTFLLVAERWWNVKKASVTEDYTEDIWRSLERDIFQQSVISASLRLKLILWLKQFSRFRPEAR